MENLAPARLTARVALRHGEPLVLYVEGLTPGFGGRLVVRQSPLKIFPPQFDVFAVPGNTGINPDAPPAPQHTTAAFAFPYPSDEDEVVLHDQAGAHTLKIISVREGEGGDGRGDEAGSAAQPLRCEWKAVQDLMPPGPFPLTVKGTCDMPTPGYRLSLERAVPQGINPAILILELVTTPPPGIVPQVVTPAHVEYREESDQEFTQVDIRSVAVIDVEHVH